MKKFARVNGERIRKREVARTQLIIMFTFGLLIMPFCILQVKAGNPQNQTITDTTIYERSMSVNGCGDEYKEVTTVYRNDALDATETKLFDLLSCIFIRADGSVEPSTAPISSVDNSTYILLDDINGTIIVERDNIVLNGAGYTVDGIFNYTVGVHLIGRRNVTIDNLQIKNFLDSGVLVETSSEIAISRNYFFRNTIGINTVNSSNSIVFRNEIETHRYGIMLTCSTDITLNNNSIRRSQGSIPVGIWVQNSSGITLSQNYIFTFLYGIKLIYSDNVAINQNQMYCGAGQGINGVESSNTQIIGNNVSYPYGITYFNSSNDIIAENLMSGIAEFTNCSNSFIIGNSISGLNLYYCCDNNTIYYNNFYPSRFGYIANIDGVNTWDNGAVGNYWADYLGNDLDGNGVGDTPYVLDTFNKDNFPLKEPWNGGTKIFDIQIYDEVFEIYTYSNSLIASLALNQTERQISFKTTGPNGTVGFYNITIPKELLRAGLLDQWVISANGEIIIPNITENITHTFLYFELTHSTKTVIIKGTNVIDRNNPTARITVDQIVKEDMPITLDGSQSTDNVEIASYVWTFIDQTPQTLTGIFTTYTFSTPGTYLITLKVTDLEGNTGMDTVTITVLDVTAPVANAGESRTVYVGELVTFDASKSFDNVEIVSYEWDFGDATIGKNVTTSHKYMSPGIYAVKLTVEDATGNKATHTITIRVDAIPIWRESWFWSLLALAATAVTATSFGIKYYRDFKKERKAREREEDFMRDVARREKKKKEIEEKYKLPPIRDSPTMQTLLEKIGLKKEG